MGKVVQVLFQGRLGNQMFQYAFGRAVARHRNAELQTTPWVGPELFEGVPVAPPVVEVGRVYEGLPCFTAREKVIALYGFKHLKRFTERYSLADAQEWFRIREEFKITPTIKMDYLALHLRHGDFLEEKTLAVPTQRSYDRAIDNTPYRDLPRVVVCEEDPHIAFDKDIPARLNHIVDFQIMMNAKVLFRANSSFSWWAGTLGECIVYSPRVTRKHGLVDVGFEKGNHCPFSSHEQPDLGVLR